MSRQLDPKAWMEKAHRELAAAKVMLEHGFLDNVFFHCQQALELALKGLYIDRHGELAPKIHNLVELSNYIPIAVPDQFGTLFRRLSRIYVRSRYEMDFWAALNDREEAQQALAATEEALKWLTEQLP